MNAITTQSPQDLLAEQLSAATDGGVNVDYCHLWTISGDDRKPVPESLGRTWDANVMAGSELFAFEVTDLRGPLVADIIGKLEPIAADLQSILHNLRKFQADQVVTD